MKLSRFDVIRLIRDWEVLEDLERELGMPKEEIIATLRKKLTG